MSTPRMNRQAVRWPAPRRVRTPVSAASRKAQVRSRLLDLLSDPRLSSFEFLTPAVLGRELFEAFSPVTKLAIEILPSGAVSPSGSSEDRASLLEREGIVVLGLDEEEVMAEPSSLVEFLLALGTALTDTTPFVPDGAS